MTLNLNSIINKDKRTKLYVVVGGLWGLISGIYYIYDLWRMAFAEVEWEYMFIQTPAIWKIIFLPAYLTYKLIFIPLSVLDLSIAVYSPFILLLLLVEIVIPILFGIGISLIAANLINKGKKVLLNFNQCKGCQNGR